MPWRPCHGRIQLPMTPIIETSLEATEAEAEALLDIIAAANEASGIHSQLSEELILRLRDPDTGAMIGGLYGELYYGWLHIRYLAVPPELRGQGLGSRLLGMAEAHARERACIGLWLDTFSFQAAEFYRRHGFAGFGEIEGYPPGHRRCFFQKRLAAALP